MNTTEQRIAEYETLHSGAIISIQLPKNGVLRQKKHESGNVDLDYIHWAVSLPGGVVNMHVHSSDLSLLDTIIRAMVELKVKVTGQGRRFLFVDLHPVDKEVSPTHKLVIVPNTFEQLDHWLVFPTPGMGGFAALINPDEKLVPPAGGRQRMIKVGTPRRISDGPYVTPVEGNRSFADMLKDRIA